MAFFDMPLEQLEKYKPAVKEPKDFDAFWSRTLAETAQYPVDAHFVQHPDTFYKLVDVYDVTYRGFAGQPVKGWFITPKEPQEQLPTIITFVGYGGGRSLPVDHLLPAIAGFANFVMDTRGQGSNWSPGDTADDAPSGPAFPGYMTRGIGSPDTYYYRRVFVDAYRAVLAAAAHPNVDPDRIGLTGGSQGGGITIAAAALAGKAVKLLMPDVPFLCHFERATTITDVNPYFEITSYLKCHRDLKDETYRTLSYFDGVNFAKRISAPAFFSLGLMDSCCPPSTIYAAFNHLKSKVREMAVYEFNNHEGGGPFQAEARMRFAAKHL